ncbi:LexA family protein [Streptomyces sp. NBC_00557]|uniref:LexA family protein n=1 Tax=Streptomyces sp. NBC_00557 TaxID=2975776 RepID=UPI002E80634C|nr:winged helix-turn-helix transcriptional regulator [Streptomyces sp. NBC_00557]WUC33726.1 winged helix-turn-helix transcriptional regulator [Streptomyces sp. NBC_00557]
MTHAPSGVPEQAAAADRQGIHEAIAERGEGPTLREIGEQVGLGSIGSVHYHLKQLEKKGVIVRECWQPRSIRLAR